MHKRESTETEYADENEDEDEDEDESSVDLGVADATTAPSEDGRKEEGENGSVHRPETDSRKSMDSARTSGSSSGTKNPVKMYKDYRNRSRDLHRQHRGLMQW